MRRISAWLGRLSDRTINAIFIAFAIISITVFLTGVASYLSNRSKLPPIEYVRGLGENASLVGPNIVRLAKRTACPGERITVPGYEIMVNRIPVRVSLVTSWWRVDEKRTAQLGSYDDIAYANYVHLGRIVVQEINITVPEDFEPGEYERVTSASTPVTFPESYISPVTVRECN